MAWNDPEIGVEWPIEEGMELIISGERPEMGRLPGCIQILRMELG